MSDDFYFFEKFVTYQGKPTTKTPKYSQLPKSLIRFKQNLFKEN